MKTLQNLLHITDEKEILILNTPKDMAPTLQELKGIDVVASLVRVSKIRIALIFITDPSQIAPQMSTLGPKLKEDTLLWFAYPKADTFWMDYNWHPLVPYLRKPKEHIALGTHWDAMLFQK